MHEQRIVKGVCHEIGHRRGYAAPQLTVYGGLAELTAAGSATPAESNGLNCLNMTNKLNTMCS